MSGGSLVVLGATGRLGRLIRPVWPKRIQTTWQARRPQDGYASCDILGDANRLAPVLQGAQAVVCLAGITNARARQKGASLRDNSRLAQAVVQAAARSGVPRVLLASSAAVYGRAQSPLHEGIEGADLSPYGLAKREMEEAASALGDAYGVEVCNMRIGNVAGADAILGDWRPGYALDTFEDGKTPKRSYVGPESLAKTIVALCVADTVEPCVNVACAGVVAMGDLLDAASLQWVPRPATADTIECVELDTTRLDRFLRLPDDAGRAPNLVAEWRRAAPQERAAE